MYAKVCRLKYPFKKKKKKKRRRICSEYPFFRDLAVFNDSQKYTPFPRNLKQTWLPRTYSWRTGASMLLSNQTEQLTFNSAILRLNFMNLKSKIESS